MARTLATYDVRVDWNNDGDYSDTGEDVTARVDALAGLSWERGRDAQRQLAPPASGRGEVTLDNRSLDYSPGNGASPLAGNVDAGRRVRVRATWLSTTYDLYSGITDDVALDPAIGRKAATIPSLGTLSRLRAADKISTGVYTNVTTSQAIGYVLDAVGWPAGERALDAGKTTLLYWWCDDDDPWAMLETLVDTEGPGATLFEDGRGYIVFHNRHRRLTNVLSTTSQGTFRDSGAAPRHREPYAYNAGLRDIINRCEIDVIARTAQALAAVWQYGATLTLGAGETVRVTASASEPFVSAVAPAAGTDFTVSAGSLTVVSLSRTSGTSAEIALTAGGGGATVAGLQLRAQSLAPKTSRVRDAGGAAAQASILRRGLRRYTRAVWPELDRNVAQDFCDAIVGLYLAPRPTVSITLGHDDDATMAHILTREIGDRITVVQGDTLDAAVFIEHIAHRVGAGNAHEVTLGCEVASTVRYAIWGTARWGQDVWGF